MKTLKNIIKTPFSLAIIAVLIPVIGTLKAAEFALDVILKIQGKA